MPSSTEANRHARADRYSFPFASYPVSFQQDVGRYAERLRGHDLEHIFDDPFGEADAPAGRFRRPLRSTSIESRLWMVRIAAGAPLAG
ncbi:MAG TPA: hypothetical protein VGH36_12710 [Acetobacteraceae bacterium]